MIQITAFCSFKISITFKHAVVWKMICFCSWLYNIPSCEYTIIYLYIWRPILLIFHLRFSQKSWLFSFYPTLKNRQSNVYSRSLSLKRCFGFFCSSPSYLQYSSYKWPLCLNFHYFSAYSGSKPNFPSFSILIFITCHGWIFGPCDETWCYIFLTHLFLSLSYFCCCSFAFGKFLSFSV